MSDYRHPTANGVACLDCPGFGSYHKGERECPEDPGHFVEPVFITKTPLGLPDDDMFHIAARGLWVYDAEDFEDDDGED